MQKIVLVTGSTRGMGRIIALELANAGNQVVLVGRDALSAESTKRFIQEKSGNSDVHVLLADLSNQTQVRALAQQFLQKFQRLDVLINNAGVHVQTHQLSVDGIEMHMAVNHLASFLLTQLLLPALQASKAARIVQVVSNSMSKTLNLEHPTNPWLPMQVYGESKLASMLCTYALARRLATSTITVNAVHPGIVATDIIADIAPPFFKPFLPIIKRFLLTPEQGATAAVFLALSPKIEGVTGKYFIRQQLKKSVPISYDLTMQEEVWQWSAAKTGTREV